MDTAMSGPNLANPKTTAMQNLADLDTSNGSRLLIYKASAGSGKTYTLTQEYMRHLLEPGSSAFQILAITFTNAATADMKRKILETLAQLAKGEYPDWEKLLSPAQRQQAKAGPEASARLHADLQTRARQKLRQILHQYQDFSIKTIDSFVQNIVRPFAFELGLPQNYTPDIELEKLSQEITDRLLDECGRPGKEIQTEILNRFLQKRDEEEKSLRLDETIQNTVQLLFDEGSFESLERLESIHADDFKGIIEKLQDYCRQIENRIETRIGQGRQIVSEAGLGAEDFHGKSRSLYAWFKPEALPGSIGALEIASPSSSILKCVEKGILKSSRYSTEAEALLQCFNNLQQIDFSHYILIKEILDNSIYALALLDRANEILEEIKETTGAIPLSEFNQRIDKALSEESNDFIYERSGTRYRHIFIDEFQDTSKLQWKNLRPLVENNLAQGNGCLIVGDPKQSIYRFRNADLAQFVNLCEAKGGLPVEVRDLQSNWRSEPGIIAFNNLFYEFIKNRYAFCPDFDQEAEEAGNPSRTGNLAQRVFKEHEQYYKAHTGQLPEPDFEAVRFYLAKSMNGEYLQDWYLRHTLEIIRQHPAGEIAILCRNNAHCRLVADYLVSQGIPVSTPDSLTLGSHDGLRLLMASLRYIDRQEEYYKAETYHLAKQLGLWPGKEEDIFKGWKSADTKRHFKNLHQLGWQQADVYDTVEAVIRFWKMQDTADQFLLTFLDQVQGNRFGRLSDLSDWWAESGADTTLCPPADGQSVRIMSIHKSKGLEFPVVIMPFICDSRLHPSELHWLRPGCLPDALGLPTALVRYVKRIAGSPAEKDMAAEKQMIEIDNLNALYVATTRACRKLYLLEAVPDRESESFKTPDAIARFAEAYPQYIELEEDGGELLAVCHNGQSAALLSSLELSHVPKYAPSFSLSAPCISPILTNRRTCHDNFILTQSQEGILPQKDTEDSLQGGSESGFPDNADAGIGEMAVGERVFNEESGKEPGYTVDIPVETKLSRFTSTDWRLQARTTALPPALLSEEQEWGNFIHKTLSRILVYTETRLEQALRTTLNEYPVFRKRESEARSTLQQLLSHPRLVPCFAEGCQAKTEMPIALSPTLTCIPDRVVFRNGSAIVLDFKTGEALPQYQKQVRGYMDALKSMGYASCQGMLVYIGKQIRIEEVDES